MTHRRPNAHLTAATLLATGVLFTLYPALRPYTDETTLEGAAAFTSTAWVLSHTAGMFGFILLAYGVHALTTAIPGRAAGAASILTWLGGSLVLPYYGAEAFGLQVIGARAVTDGDVSLLQMADAFRFAPLPMALFGTGLVLLAVAGVLVAITLWRSSTVHRLGGLLLGLGLVGYLPQFFAPPGGRIAHGVLLGLGCLMLGAAVLRARERRVDPSLARRHAAKTGV